MCSIVFVLLKKSSSILCALKFSYFEVLVSYKLAWNMSEYESAVKSKLKLKTDSGIKKKKKSKDKKKMLDKIALVEKTTGAEYVQQQKAESVPLTKAERAYLMMKEKKQMERILEKASKTHKQRVEDFNRHLDSLTEHYDIPKVSWTK